MTTAFLCSWLILFGTSDDTLEPPAQFTLQVNGQNHPITEGQEIKIPGDFSNLTVSLHPNAIRHFPYGGVDFDYPTYFTWEAEKDGADRTWTLSGNDFKVIFFVMAQSLTLDDYLASLEEQFGRENTQQFPQKRQMAGTTLEGRLLKASITGIPLFMEVYSLPTSKGTRLLVFQDFPDDGAKHSPEGEKTLKLISDSFTDRKSLH